MDMPDLAPVADPRDIFEQAAARGVLVYEPRSAVNCIWHWICLGQDRRGNVWFRHHAEAHCLVMPPDTPPDGHMLDERAQDGCPEDACRRVERRAERRAERQAERQESRRADARPSERPAHLAMVIPFPKAPPLPPRDGVPETGRESPPDGDTP